ncbi:MULTISPECIES: FMN-dependent NADH-azoreductase [Arthrobacter]|uniref:FMN dependent NADH:quinone oxidoreductase n=1 Tax=Arthrobacter terricola TaxID=2547396 RepID=A0A4R5K5S9_9MICC|nr:MULTISPECIES: NAD(P)H-dependent oxidoreductase [Arthrobacter]MBT8159631.1 NAD(P)H-dependent oxidoreductase [Arthrobacter sp. GN70]TDF87509.1 FMN-dependent NADH-azoreductase [Arthrobacter terricola]
MTTLLHIDSSVFPGEASSSRSVTAAFRRAWEEQQPEGAVIYRDIASDPIPHITADAWSAGYASPSERTPEQSRAFTARVRLIEELEQADAVLIGAPMHNYSIPSTLKAWLDNVLLLGRTAGESRSAQGTPAVVVASRGGSYRPGTPREGYEFVQNYLEAVLKDTLGLDLDFIIPELTMAARNPAMSELIPLYEASRKRAFEDAATKAKEIAARVA